jgi:hypothetical protein
MTTRQKRPKRFELESFHPFSVPDTDLKYHMLRITLNNPNFYSKNNHYLSLITGQDYFSFNLSATSNFKSLTFPLWWIYNGMTNTHKPSTIAGSGVCVCVRAHTHKEAYV